MGPGSTAALVRPSRPERCPTARPARRPPPRKCRPVSRRGRWRMANPPIRISPTAGTIMCIHIPQGRSHLHAAYMISPSCIPAMLGGLSHPKVGDATHVPTWSSTRSAAASTASTPARASRARWPITSARRTATDHGSSEAVSTPPQPQDTCAEDFGNRHRCSHPRMLAERTSYETGVLNTRTRSRCRRDRRFGCAGRWLPAGGHCCSVAADTRPAPPMPWPERLLIGESATTGLRSAPLLCNSRVAHSWSGSEGARHD